MIKPWSIGLLVLREAKYWDRVLLQLGYSKVWASFESFIVPTFQSDVLLCFHDRFVCNWKATRPDSVNHLFSLTLKFQEACPKHQSRYRPDRKCKMGATRLPSPSLGPLLRMYMQGSEANRKGMEKCYFIWAFRRKIIGLVYYMGNQGVVSMFWFMNVSARFAILQTN